MPIWIPTADNPLRYILLAGAILGFVIYAIVAFARKDATAIQGITKTLKNAAIFVAVMTALVAGLVLTR